jgi:hypothetical protein
MAKRKAGEILRKQKEAKQKKLLLVLVPIFVLLLVWQGPSYVRMLKGGDEPVAATDTPGATVPTGTVSDPSVAPAPSTATPNGGTPAPGEGGAAVLTDSDRPSAAEAGQLVSFDRFRSKDPFRQIVKADAGTGDTGGTGGTGGTVTVPSTPGGSGGSGNGGTGSSGGSDNLAEPVSAVLEVNGVKEKVGLDGAFPESEELFKLARLSRTSAWIGLVTGEFSNGKDSIEVDVGDTLNLVSQPDGIRYTIKVVSIQVA